MCSQDSFGILLEEDSTYSMIVGDGRLNLQVLIIVLLNCLFCYPEVKAWLSAPTPPCIGSNAFLLGSKLISLSIYLPLSSLSLSEPTGCSSFTPTLLLKLSCRAQEKKVSVIRPLLHTLKHTHLLFHSHTLILMYHSVDYLR